MLECLIKGGNSDTTGITWERLEINLIQPKRSHIKFNDSPISGEAPLNYNHPMLGRFLGLFDF